MSSYEEPLPSDFSRRPWLLLPTLAAWLTVEPAIAAYSFSGGMVFGSGAQTQLMLWKVNIQSIRGHRPKSSLGDKILAKREGDYKNCFREGEGKHLWEGYGKKIFFLQIFSQKY